MKTLTFVILMALILMVGCSPENPVAVESEKKSINEDAVSPLNKPAGRPLALVAKYRETWETVKPPDFAVGDPIAEVVIQGYGKATHLGFSTLYIHEFINLGVTPNILNGDYFALTSVKTGDKLEGTVEGQSEGDAEGNLRFWGTVNFTGGTGKYVGATGQAQFEGGGKNDLATGTGSGWVKFRGYLYLP